MQSHVGRVFTVYCRYGGKLTVPHFWRYNSQQKLLPAVYCITGTA